MSNWIYTVRERFTSAHGDRWTRYLEWSGVSHVVELVTLDTILCCDRIGDLISEDWAYNVQADFRLTWFTNLDYLRQRSSLQRGRDQLIAAIRQPAVRQQPPSGFIHCGFDILDYEGAISVLTNCGRFSNIFKPSEVNRWGLIEEIEKAQAIAQQIRSNFPDEPHCHQCQVWQVARTIVSPEIED